MSLIYSPKEDSYLLEKVIRREVPNILKKNKELKFLEIGIGSGIQLIAARESKIKKKNIVGIDINPEAVLKCKKIGFNCIESNLFKNIKERFDLIVFNPPYLPEDKYFEDEESKLITTGGKNGSKVINNFLFEAKNHLKKGGRVFLLTSSLTKKINWNKFKKRILEEEKLFFEKLIVWELTI